MPAFDDQEQEKSSLPMMFKPSPAGKGQGIFIGIQMFIDSRFHWNTVLIPVNRSAILSVHAAEIRVQASRLLVVVFRDQPGKGARIRDGISVRDHWSQVKGWSIPGSVAS